MPCHITNIWQNEYALTATASTRGLTTATYTRQHSLWLPCNSRVILAAAAKSSGLPSVRRVLYIKATTCLVMHSSQLTVSSRGAFACCPACTGFRLRRRQRAALMLRPHSPPPRIELRSDHGKRHRLNVPTHCGSLLSPSLWKWVLLEINVIRHCRY